jgi:hypothetical protein
MNRFILPLILLILSIILSYYFTIDELLQLLSLKSIEIIPLDESVCVLIPPIENQTDIQRKR